MAIDPSGNLGKKDQSGKIESIANRDETIQQHFFRCIEEDLEPLTSAEEGRKTLRTVLAIRESARRGTSVHVASIRPAARR